MDAIYSHYLGNDKEYEKITVETTVKGDMEKASQHANLAVKRSKNGRGVFVGKDFKKGRKVTFDYSTILAKDDIWEMKCNCGSKHCRKTIKKFSTLPKRLKEKYTPLGMVPKYILL